MSQVAIRPSPPLVTADYPTASVACSLIGVALADDALPAVLARWDDMYTQRYTLGCDARLRRAVEVGVEAVVLRSGIAKTERKFISQMLNSTFEYRWVVGRDDSVRVDNGQELRQFTSFDGGCFAAHRHTRPTRLSAASTHTCCCPPAPILFVHAPSRSRQLLLLACSALTSQNLLPPLPSVFTD